jgi:hypothetical protein
MLIQLLSLSILGILPAPADQGTISSRPAAAVERAATVPALERIAVIGASLSDGFGLDLDVGARTILADIVEATLKSKHDPVASPATGYFFMDPVKSGTDEIAKAKAKNPTLIVGLDFLFWFGYGFVREESKRTTRFDQGLSLLESFTCPVLVGDLPDMSQALNGKSQMTGGPLLQKEQMPAPETLKQMNERLTAWAAEHPNVVVVPLARLLARMHAGEELTLRGRALPKETAEALFQKDLLHPTLHGSVTTWLFALDALVHAQPTFPAEAFDWDPAAIAKKVYDAKEPERQARIEKQKKRAKTAPVSTGSNSSGKPAHDDGDKPH